MRAVADVTPVRVEGLKETLRVLGKFDTTLRKQFTKDFKRAVMPTIEAAQANVPSRPPLSGMANNWKGRPLWEDGKEEKRIKLKVDTRKARARNISKGVQWESVGTIRVIASGRGLAIFDMAGRKSAASGDTAGDRLIDRMNSRYRPASRAMWPAAEETLNEVTRNCLPIIRRAEDEANRLLAVNASWLGGTK